MHMSSHTYACMLIIHVVLSPCGCAMVPVDNHPQV